MAFNKIFTCLTTGCGKQCAKKEVADKCKKFGKQAHEEYCYNCYAKFYKMLNETPIAEAVKKVLKQQNNHQKRKRKSSPK